MSETIAVNAFLPSASNGIGGSLPDGWRWVRLGEVCESSLGTRNPTQMPEELFTYVDISSVDSRTKRIVSPTKLLGRNAPSRARKVIRSDDVLVATTRPNLNAVALASPELDNQICSTGFCVLRANGQARPAFIFAFVQSSEFVHTLSELVKGALYPAVTDAHVRNVWLPLPPLSEQKRIARLVTDQFAIVERARAAAQAQLDAAKELPAAYLRAVFGSREAQRWPRVRLGDVCCLLPAKSIATQGDARVQAITTACLTESGFNANGIKLARMVSRDVAQCVVSAGEVLVARSNTTELVGRAAMFSGDPKGAVASDLTIRVWPKSPLEAEFLASYLSFLYVDGYWKQRAGGASGSMKKITRRQILAVSIPILQGNEQMQIVARLREKVEQVEQARRALEEQLEAINRLPAVLLGQAFAGRL